MRHHVTVCGVLLEYLERAGTEGCKDPPLFLLHGLLATAETFIGLMDNLPAGPRMIALDLLSARPAAPGTELNVHFSALATLIVGFMEAVGLQRPVMLGHSHGGVLALCVAAAREELLHGLVLMAPAHPFEGYRSRVVQFYLKPHGRMLALAIPLAPTWAILRAYREATGPASRFSREHLRPHMRVLRSRKTLALVLDMLATWERDMADLREALAARPVTLPTLLMWGDHDYIVPMTSAPALREHLTRSTLVVLRGAGHLLSEEMPTLCAEYVRDWMAGHPLPEAV